MLIFFFAYLPFEIRFIDYVMYNSPLEVTLITYY